MSGAYAALVSLIQTIHTIQSHTRYSLSLDENQIDSLREIARFFLEFVERQNSSEEVKDLQTQIASAARLAEDVLESRVVDQIQAGSTRDRVKNNPGYSSDLEEILQDIMHPIKEKVENIKEEISRVKDEEATDFTAAAASSSRSPQITGKSSVVGLDYCSLQLMDQLISHQSSRHIIPIVGMGGIGKTTLARHVFEKPLVKEHFDVRAWVTISQNYNTRDILLQLLSRDGESDRDTIDESGEQLHKKLWGRKYLIVLDDMWDNKAWDEVKNYIPDNENGSRIVITTRLSNLATYFSSSYLAIKHLDEESSWNLFCEKAFGEKEDCPFELLKTGKKIAQQCQGLPLSIVVMGGLLRTSSRTEEQWAEVSRNLTSYMDSGEEKVMSILSLSYNHLPAHLKLCFLYLGNFPQGKEILVSTLVRSWIAEGYIRGNGSESLEEIGEGYLRDLVDRNLISVEEKGWNGRLSTCRIHDLLRDVCLKVGEEEKFFCVSKHPAAASRCHQPSCLICSARRSYKDKLRLLRILPKVKEELYEVAFDPDCLVPVFDHLNMRDAFFQLYWVRSPESLPLDRRRTAPQIRSRLPYIPLPSSLSLLWNLQTLVIHGVFTRTLAPDEIWEMPQLRHVDVFDMISIPDPPRFDHTSSVVMQNLQTLLVVENFKLTEEVCRRIPNIKELQMYYTLDSSSSSSSSSGYSQQNLNRFHRLESLRCEFEEGTNWRDFALDFTFPHSLKKLWLGGSGLDWEDLSMIGSLPHLEALTLSCKNAVRGNEWNPVEVEFQRLKSLAIYHCEDLVRWNAESSHFPVLESLTIGHAYELVDFPSDIGEIPTLTRVYLDRCSVSAAVSAMRMLKEQEEMGNEELVLEIQFKDKEEMERVREIVQEEGLECSNLILNYFSVY